jgi:hypothetical protein
VKIFTRPSEWDYSWLDSFRTEVSFCCFYEYARYALLVAAPNSQFVFPTFGAGPYLWGPILELWGPILCLSYGLPEKVKFPQMPYREARKFFTVDSETMSATIEVFSHRAAQSKETLVISHKEINRQQAEEILAQFKRRHRGAGARIRQERTDLKCLGATKLLDCMTAPDAIAHTIEALGRPLFKNESEWSRAQKRARTTLEPYCAEATDLYQALRPPPSDML